MDAKQIAEFDQAMEQMRDFYPRIIWSFYEGLVEAGFSNSDAVVLSMPLATRISETLLPGGTRSG